MRSVGAGAIRGGSIREWLLHPSSDGCVRSELRLTTQAYALAGSFVVLHCTCGPFLFHLWKTSIYLRFFPVNRNILVFWLTTV